MLWTMVLLSLLVTALVSSGSGRVRQAAALRRNAELQAAADGALHEAALHVLDTSRGHWPADGTIHEVRRDGFRLTIRMRSEAGKINPNRASPELIAALLQALGIGGRDARVIARHIVAWRVGGGVTGTQTDSLGGNPVGDAEAQAYRAAGRDYIPPGRPFQTLGEIGLVLGVTPELLAAMTPHLSLYRQVDPDMAAADPVVLAAMQLLMGPGAAQQPQGDSAQTPPDDSVMLIETRAADGAGHSAHQQAIVGFGDASDARGGDRGDRPPFQILSWGVSG